MDTSRTASLFGARSAFLLTGLLLHSAFADVVVDVEEVAYRGEVRAVDEKANLELKLTDGRSKGLPCDEVLSIEFERESPAQVPKGAAVAAVLDGSRVCGLVAGGSKSTITLDSPSLGEVGLKLESIKWLDFPQESDEGPLPEPQPTAPKEDVVYFLNADKMSGLVEAVTKDGITLKCALGEVPIAFAGIRRLVLAGTRDKPPRPQHLLANVSFADGSVVNGRLVSLTEKSLRLDSALAGNLESPREQLARVAFRNGKLVYLSDLEPAEVKETPYFDQVWRYRRDTSLDGNPLRLRGRVYRKGLGVHSRCELTYELDGKFSRFCTDMGIDDEVRGKGSVVFQVLADGKQVYDSGLVTGKSEAVTLKDISVSGIKRLTLKVDFGEDFDFCDHADWANARVLR